MDITKFIGNIKAMSIDIAFSFCYNKYKKGAVSMTTIQDIQKAVKIINNFLLEDKERSLVIKRGTDTIKLCGSDFYQMIFNDPNCIQKFMVSFLEAMEYIKKHGGMIRKEGDFLWIKYTKIDNGFWYCQDNGELCLCNGVPLRVTLTGSLFDCGDWEYKNGANSAN